MKHIKLFLLTAIYTLCFASPAMSDEEKKQTSYPTTVHMVEIGSDKTAPTSPYLNTFNPFALLPIQAIMERLPSIKVYHQEYTRDIVVAKLNCPLTVATGMIPTPIEMMFEMLDKVTFTLNEKEFFKYDIKLVCG